VISINALTIARLVQTLFNFYSFLVLAYCLLSWFPIRSGGLMEDIGAVLQSIVGPYLNLFRRFLPPMGGIDWSPVLAILVLNLLENLIIRLLL
jgi:YggT family protein